jgi:hypothetical protein
MSWENIIKREDNVTLVELQKAWDNLLSVINETHYGDGSVAIRDEDGDALNKLIKLINNIGVLDTGFHDDEEEV